MEDPDNLNLLNGIIQQNAQLIKQNIKIIDSLREISLNTFNSQNNKLAQYNIQMIDLLREISSNTSKTQVKNLVRKKYSFTSKIKLKKKHSRH